MAEAECDGLADAELWAAIDKAAAARNPSPCSAMVLHSRQIPQMRQTGPIVEYPGSPEVRNATPSGSRYGPQNRVITPPSTSYQGSRFEDNRGQKRHFDGDNHGNSRLVKQASSGNRSVLGDLNNTISSRELVAVQNAWMPGEPENWPLHQNHRFQQQQQQQVYQQPWTCNVPSPSMFKHIQDSAMAILEKGDYMSMHGKPYIKKSGWRKIAFFFNISFEVLDRTIERDPSGSVLRAEFLVRATMQSGRYSDGWGSCDLREKKFSKPNHDIPCTAETRAKTRACQDLLGIGEYKGGV